MRVPTTMLKLLAVSLSFLVTSSTDKFNYDKTDWEALDYGPEDWGNVECDDVATCPGWPTNWGELGPFIPYKGTANMCKDCSSSDDRICKRHIQSPIHLSKKDAIANRECIDRHRMRYFAGECRFNKMDFQILPHVLRAYQPRQNCSGDFQPGIDFSRGFPHPWLLSFTDISIPSQHVIDGKRYDAEVVLSHTYSVDNGDRLIGNVAIMLEKGKASDKYDFLDLYFRGWEKVAKKHKQKCFPEYLAKLELEADQGAWNQTGTATFGDADDTEEGEEENDEEGADVGELETAQMVEKTFPLHSPRMRDDTSVPRHVSKKYYDREFHPYDWYDRVNTEYYFRYEGSTLEPPCLETVHWRVIHKPIKVSPGQLRKLYDLLNNRLNPFTCKKETAGKLKSSKSRKVLVNRPLQTTTRRHKLVYCECADWEPKSAADRDFCNITESK